MATAILRGHVDFQTVRQGIIDGVLQSGVSAQLIDEAFYDLEQAKFTVLVFEKYYMRVGNRLSVTVSMVQAAGAELELSVIGAAGGTGALFRFNWGSEDSFVMSVVEIAQQLGLTLVSREY